MSRSGRALFQAGSMPLDKIVKANEVVEQGGFRGAVVLTWIR